MLRVEGLYPVRISLCVLGRRFLLAMSGTFQVLRTQTRHAVGTLFDDDWENLSRLACFSDEVCSS